MAEPDPLDYKTALSFLSWPNDPRANQTLRQKIALQLMSTGRKGYPKNIGEGLTAIGDSIGDIGMARMLERGDLSQQDAAKAAASGLRGDGPRAEAGDEPTRTAYIPPARSAVIPADETPAEPAPPPALTNTAAQPSSMLSPNTVAVQPNAVGGLAPGLTPQQAAPYMDARATAVPTFPRQPPPGRFAPPDELNQADPRMAAARALMAQRTAQAVPQPNPMQAGAQAPLATPSPSALAALPGGTGDQFAGLPPEITNGASAIRSAPSLPSGIQSAPPVQVAQAGGQPQAIPGYVTPPVQDLSAPPIAPLSPLGRKALEIINANPNNEYVLKGEAGQTYQNELARQKLEQDQINEVYKAKILRNEQLRQLRETQLGDQAKRQTDFQEAQQKIREGNLPKAHDISGKYMQDPVSGVFYPPKIEGEDPNAAPNVKLTEDQHKQLVFHGWASLANNLLSDPATEQLLAHGRGQEFLGKVPIFGNSLQNDQYRNAKNAADNFVLAFMRSTSGAQYGEKEREDHARAMLPKAGDDIATLANKAAQRKNFVDAEYAGLGEGGQKAANWLAKQRKEQGPDANMSAIDARQRSIDAEMATAKPASKLGEIRFNKQKTQQRVWNGSHWMEL